LNSELEPTEILILSNKGVPEKYNKRGITKINE
jgi:hypothetical protein